MEISRSQFIRHGLVAAAGVGTGLLAAARKGRADPVAGAGQGAAGQGAAGRGGASLRFTQVELHLRHAWALSRNTSTVKRNYLVELTCDGITGIGEAAPNVRFHETPESVAEALLKARDIVAGVHPGHRVELSRRLLARLPHAYSARCAVDIAAWDWQTQALGVPLHRWLGLDPAAAPLTSFSISIAGKDELEQKVKEAAPYPLLKVKLGGKNGISDQEIIEIIHRAAPGKRLRVDPNEGWTPGEARQKLAWLAGLRLSSSRSKNAVPLIELCEQPLPAADLPALRDLYRDRAPFSGLPLLLDESVLSPEDIPGLAGACDGIVIKLQKAGGITGALDQIAVARALGFKVMLGCMIETAVGITAAAHLAPLCDYIDLDGNLLIDNDPYRGVQVEAGKLRLPEGPGLGVSRV